MESGNLWYLGLGEEALEKSDRREDPPSPGRKAQQDTTPMSLRRLVSKQRTERRQAEKAEWQRVIKDAGKPCRGQLSESLGLASGISLVTLVKLLSMASRRGSRAAGARGELYGNQEWRLHSLGGLAGRGTRGRKGKVTGNLFFIFKIEGF